MADIKSSKESRDPEKTYLMAVRHKKYRKEKNNNQPPAKAQKKTEKKKNSYQIDSNPFKNFFHNQNLIKI